MIKLPYLLSVFKLFEEKQQNESFLDINKEFNNSTEYNKFINYKIYNLNTKKSSSYIRNQIKTIKGYNTATTVQENESLKKKINELTDIIEKYKNNNNLNTSIQENTNLNNEKTNHIIQENKSLIEENKSLIEENKKLIQKNNQLLNNLKNLKNNILLKLYDIINFDLDK